MDLVVHTLSSVMTYGSIVALVAMVVQIFWDTLSKDPLLGPILNTTLVALESTKGVWMPIVSGALGVLIPVSQFLLVTLKPFVKGLVHGIREGLRLSLQTIYMLRRAGLDVSAALRQLAVTLSEFGSSVLIVGRTLSKALFYSLKGLSVVLSSVESALTATHRVLFSSHEVTWEDLVNIAIPLGIVMSLILIAMWRSAPRRQAERKAFVPRRSSRLERKRAMLMSADLQSVLPSCAEPTLPSPNL